MNSIYCLISSWFHSQTDCEALNEMYNELQEEIKNLIKIICKDNKLNFNEINKKYFYNSDNDSDNDSDYYNNKIIICKNDQNCIYPYKKLNFDGTFKLFWIF